MGSTLLISIHNIGMKYIHYCESVSDFEDQYENCPTSDPWVSVTEGWDGVTYSPTIDVEAAANGYEYVDLGLPSGTLWAPYNIGALSPEDYGSYFAWGETSIKSDYSWSTYAWGTSENDITKYNTSDRKYSLDQEDDVASDFLGGDWMMPTETDVSELFDYTTLEYITTGGTRKIKLTSLSNSNSIIFPLGGYKDGTSTYSQNSELLIWTSKWPAIAYAYAMFWNPEEHGFTQWTKKYGCPVRGVLRIHRPIYNQPLEAEPLK